MTTEPLDLLTVSQVAAEMDRPIRTVHNWINDGRLEATKLGDGLRNPYFITRAALEQFKSESQAAS